MRRGFDRALPLSDAALVIVSGPGPLAARLRLATIGPAGGSGQESGYLGRPGSAGEELTPLPD